MAQPSMPTGTVTFLLTDVEGSSRRWEIAPDEMRAAIVRHYALLDDAIAANSGVRPVEQGEGDSIVAVFPRASDGVATALAAQRALVRELGELFRVRMALHTGEAALRDEGNYVGQTIIRAARLRACGHGGQILMSRTTADLVVDRLPDGIAVVPLGRHRLRDLNRPEEVWQLTGPELPRDFPPLSSLDALPTNMPVSASPLIGRITELDRVGALVRDPGTRLLTLTGPGGVGKTRLALQAATDNMEAFPDGAWWVELAPIDSDDRVADTVAQALQLPEATGVSVVAQVASALAEKETLIVLDNCEHVIDGCAHLVDELLARCRSVSIVCTAREPLGSVGEVVWRVPSLSLPEAVATSPEQLTGADAIRFFVERAKGARATFELSETNAATVHDICRRLDGIALALELAAARVRTLPVERLASELDERFRVLTGGARTSLPRQQTLLASVEWSHELLSADERHVFRRLAVFVGSFDLDAAEYVASDEEIDGYAVLELLGRLVDKGLVQLDDTTGRYQLLETLRQYALEQCRAAGELEATRDRHLAWAHSYLYRFAPLECDRTTFEAIDREYPNLRSALEWSTGRDDDAAGSIVTALATYWGLAGRLRDAFGLADPVLARLRETEPGRWSTAVSLLAWVRGTAGDVDFVLADTAEALEIARAAADPASEARCLYALAIVGTAESELFERVFDLASEAGSGRFQVYGALLATVSKLGTDQATPLLERLTALATSFDDETLDFIRVAMAAEHVALRSDYPQAVLLARQLLGRGTDGVALVALFTVVGQIVHTALRAGDAMLVAEAMSQVPSELRELPGAAWWFQLFAHAAGMTSGKREPTELAVPPPMLVSLMVADLLFRVLLDTARHDAVLQWADAVPASWSAAHASATIARAWVARKGSPMTATELAHEALAEAAHHGLRPLTAEALELVAIDWTHDLRYADAVRLLGATAGARAEMGATWRPSYYQAGVDEAIEKARAELGDDFDLSYDEGTRLSLDDAVTFAQRMRGGRARQNLGWASLTPTELAVAREIGEGRTNAEAAERLFVAPSTVKTHLERIYRKLGINTRAALAAEVARHEPA